MPERAHTRAHAHTRTLFVPSAHGTAAHLRFTAAQVLALQALSQSSEEEHQAASASTSTSRSSPQVKYNSTSSLYIDSTITTPCTEEMIFCVSVVLHDRIDEGEQATAEAAARGESLPRFKVDSKDLMQVVEDASGHGPSEDATSCRSSCRWSEDAIFHILRSIYRVAEFSPECLVIALLFIERLRTVTGVPLIMANWQPILLAALLLAQKVWDDRVLRQSLLTLLTVCILLARCGMTGRCSTSTLVSSAAPTPCRRST